MKQKKSTNISSNNNEVRVEAGVLKGNKIKFISHKGLRPTGSRCKQTLFNWLQFELLGIKVLDLFAGSGSLGIECISRGAIRVDFCENTKKILDQIEVNCSKLNLFNVEKVYKHKIITNFKLVDSFSYCNNKSSEQFDLIIIDPPFMSHKEIRIINDILNNNWLSTNGKIYLEADSSFELSDNLPTNIVLLKENLIGNVKMFLFRFSGNS